MTDEKTLYEQKIRALYNEISYLNDRVEWYRSLYTDYYDMVARQQTLIKVLSERLERLKMV